MSSPKLAVIAEVRMHSELGHGLFILDPPLFGQTINGKFTDGPLRQKSRILGAWNHSRYGFKNKGGQLIPDTITFNFQYQTMSDCGPGDGRKSKGTQYNKIAGYDMGVKIGPDYIDNDSCKTFTPTGEIYNRTLNHAEMLKDDKYIKRHNKKMKNNWGEIYYSTVIFEFYDKGVIKVKTRGGNTNRFR